MSGQSIDLQRRRFLRLATQLFAAIGAGFAAIPFISSWLPSARARAAGAPVETDISDLRPGEMKVVEWRGKPVWVIRRNNEALLSLDQVADRLRDPESIVEQQPIYARNHHRSRDPEFLVLVGICTHLGCSPKYVPTEGELGPDWPGGFYCPCHGSKFDMAGRVFKNVPAPINLEVPPYRLLAGDKIIIGEEDA